MGGPPDDDAGATNGVPEPPMPRVGEPLVPHDHESIASDRAKSLAARIDAMNLPDEDDDAERDSGSISIDVDDPSTRSSAPTSTIQQLASAPTPTPGVETSAAAIELADIDMVEDDKSQKIPSPPPLRVPPPPPRPIVAIPPRPPPGAVRVPPIGAKPPMPPTRTSQPLPTLRTSQPVAGPAVSIPPSAPAISMPPPPPRAADDDEDEDEDDKFGGEPGRGRRPTGAPPIFEGVQRAAPTTPLAGPDALEGVIGAGNDELAAGGVEVSTQIANIVVDQPVEALLESPTVVDRALGELGDAGGEKRAQALSKELDATTDATAAAYLAYELGELFERRLADEARAVKAYGRALTLDPSLRPNLWAIRRIFYRRGLWPNLAKLIGAEVDYARDDYERADLLLEQARVSSHQVGDTSAAREALDEATRIAPTHQGALLELERLAARDNDTQALLDVWERLAEAVEHLPRKISYWLEVGRTAGAGEYTRAQEAFAQASVLAKDAPALAERVAREQLRVAEENGPPEDVASAIDGLATVLLATFGPAGPGAEPGVAPTDGSSDRATSLRRELVALRRRQAQIARVDAPEKAWDVLQQALALSPGEPLVLADLTELAEELGRYEDLAELVQSWQAVEGDPGRAMVLSIRRADALLRGGQLDQARALLASLEASAPGFIVLTSASERDALGRADPAALAKTYTVAAQAALLGTWLGPGQNPEPDPHAAAALFVQAAELHAYEVSGQEGIDEARTLLGNALEAVPSYAPAIEALTELDEATGNVADALVRLKAAAEAATSDVKRSFIERGIRLARTQGDLEAVLDLERQLVTLAPGELGVKWRMESTLAQLGRDEERAQLLAELASAEPDATRRGTALLAAARLRERSGGVEGATELYRQVLALWPDDTFARESLIDLLRAQERWAELVSERRAEARALPDGPVARRALREAAWILEVRLGDVASAAAVYEEWLTRIPEDRPALEGAARARGQFGDRNGEVVARRTIAELDPTPESQWLLARALERAGQFDEAADVFRALSIHEQPSVAATSAALGLADLAAGRADTVMRLEATSALAGRTTDPRLGAALAEDSGWMYALVLEDFDRAGQSFDAAIAMEPHRKGALLGAALVAARRQDAASLQQSYDALADSVQMPEAAAALHMRAAAMAAASGDLDVANQRVAAARANAPDDVSALVVLAEANATPHVDTPTSASPEDVASAMVDPLLARAEVLELRSALADDPAAQSAWELDRAEALELAGRLREAGAVVTSVLKAQPGDLRALEALRRMAKRVGDKATWAHASYLLARAIGDPQARVTLLRDAVGVFDQQRDVPGAAALTLAAYKRLLAVEPGAPELDRLLAILRERADVNGLVATLSDRLTFLEGAESPNPAAAVPLLLERATVLHGLGDADGAMADLDALLDRSASHVEALRFRADLALHAGDVEYAVNLWRRCIAAETRPARRREVELQLAQVLAENVNDIAGAIENIERVLEAQPDDAQLRERLLGLCLRANDFERASRELRMLARLRPTPPEKAREELRLGLMLRDRLNDRPGARLALDRARTFDPLNLDVVRELSELLDSTPRAQVLAATAANFRASIAQSPSSAQLYERLAQVTGWQSDVDARWLALVGLEALGTPSVDQRQVLAQGRQKLGAPSRVKLDDAARGALRIQLAPALRDLWRAIGPSVQVATGIDPGKLGFVRGDKIALKKLGEKYEPLAVALACFGVEDVEIYISASRVGVARSLPAETPILCIGADVASAAMSQHRFALGRAVAVLAENLAGLADLRDGELGWTIAAALRASDVAIPTTIAENIVGEESSIAERAKVLKKEMGRKQKAAVVELVKTKVSDIAAFDDLRRAAIAIGQRAGLVWSGDLAVAHAQLDVGKGGKSLLDSPSALDLTAWAVSEDHGKLRERLNVTIKGAR
ncbi:MAG: hypothetical protein ACKV2T_14290 [Kofleriaceae bacterium]